MSGRFEWREVTTEYRDVLSSPRGDELRWLVNRERMRDTVTGETVTRSIMRSPGVCVMVPILPDERILLVRQYRFPVGGELWELPAGTLEGREEGGRAVPTETPEACAGRELIEETGYEAAELARIAEWYAMPGGNDLRVYLFAARGLVQRTQRLDEGAIITKTLAGLLHTLGRRPGGIQLPS
jgi:8-oxo-dGTP pyrophosphatase MutT (NUDIX family)